MKDRCITDEQKTEFCLQLLEIWKSSPELRFGQLLLNSIKLEKVDHAPVESMSGFDIIMCLKILEVDKPLAQRERILYNIEDLELLRGLK